MDQTFLTSLIQRINSSDANVRAQAADEVSDVHKGLNQEGVAQLVSALVAARVSEQDAASQEAQLNALCELKAWHEVNPRMFDALSILPSFGLSPSQSEYVEDLLG